MCKKRGGNSLALTPFHEFILVYCGVVGFGGMGLLMDGREQKVGFAEKKLRL